MSEYDKYCEVCGSTLIVTEGSVDGLCRGSIIKDGGNTPIPKYSKRTGNENRSIKRVCPNRKLVGWGPFKRWNGHDCHIEIVWG